MSDLVSAIAATGLSGRKVTCSTNELAVMQPPRGMTCGDYLQPYAKVAGGSIYNPSATSNCHYCPMSNADQFLGSVAISYSTRWRNYGIGFAYIVFNIFMAVVLYYLIRVRKGSGKAMSERLGWVLKFWQRDPSEEKTDTRAKAKAPQDKATPMMPDSANREENH
jgi:ATP-binding cassette subfamily G (WHITE) protein 2 (PDR)